MVISRYALLCPGGQFRGVPFTGKRTNSPPGTGTSSQKVTGRSARRPPQAAAHGLEVALKSTTNSILIVAQLTPQCKKKIIISQL
jgi:hypothetical protein